MPQLSLGLLMLMLVVIARPSWVANNFARQTAHLGLVLDRGEEASRMGPMSSPGNRAPGMYALRTYLRQGLIPFPDKRWLVRDSAFQIPVSGAFYWE